MYICIRKLNLLEIRIRGRKLYLYSAGHFRRSENSLLYTGCPLLTFINYLTFEKHK